MSKVEMRQCQDCEGTGNNGMQAGPCPGCGGSGMVPDDPAELLLGPARELKALGAEADRVACQQCGGLGMDSGYPCESCAGTGEARWRT